MLHLKAADLSMYDLYDVFWCVVVNFEKISHIVLFFIVDFEQP